MKKRVRLMLRNWRIANLFGLPFRVRIKAAMNGFRMKCRDFAPEEGGTENGN